MASDIISFKKEFEEVILKQNVSTALNSLIKDSKEYIYLQFCEEFKKCISNKVISEELKSILKNAESLPNNLFNILITRTNLLEYDLSSTPQERKNEIIDKLYTYYCNKRLDYNPPYFIEEKNEQDSDMEIEEEGNNKNKDIYELTDDIIKKKVEFNLKIHSGFRGDEIDNSDYFKKIEIILRYIEKNENLAVKIINEKKVPFYLMNEEEFSKVIQFFNSCKKTISNYNHMTYEQLERLLNEVNNPEYISKDKILSRFINKKYDKLLENNEGDLNQIKSILGEIYNIFIKHSSKHCKEVLIYYLKINKMQDIYDINPFIEYLKLKRESSRDDDEDEDEDYILDVPNINISKNKLKLFIEELLLDFFIYEKAKKENFIDLINKDTLERIYYISTLLKGEEHLSPINDKYITYQQYCLLAEKKEITICEHNPKEFKIEDEIKIDLLIKNIKYMNISVYEINTENYYLDKKSSIDSSIDIEGLIASQNFDIKVEGTENPLRRIRKTIELNQIPKDRPGVYLIDLLGDGISSRIIIKKGSLNLISRNTEKGIMCQIINEKNELLKDSKTFLWYNNIKFSCEPNEGLIVLPYKILSEDDETCILVHDSYADISQIDTSQEEFQLKGYFQFLNESLIWGSKAKVVFRPFLFVNNRFASIENIKNGRIIVNMNKCEINKYVPIKSIFENIQFNDDDNKEYKFEIFIPVNLYYLEFRFECEVINSKGEAINLFYRQDSEFSRTDYDISKNLFRKCGKKYFYENLGRNGEKIKYKSNKYCNVELYTNYYKDKINIKMAYDKEGKLNLGELKNVTKIKFEREMWYHLNNYFRYTYPKRIDIIEGESFTLPLYLNNTEINLENNYFILYEYLYKKEEPIRLMDVKNEIIINKLNINGDDEHFYEFKLGHNLIKGNYYLLFGEGLDDYLIKIDINVNEGTHWMNLENYIINSKLYIENSENKTPIYLKNLNIDKENNLIKFECAKTRRNIKYTRAYIYFFQYQIPKINIFFDEYHNILKKDTQNFVYERLDQWENIYLSNKTLNEEMEYTINRKNNNEDKLGNNLPLPSLLLKRDFIKECDNEEEKLKKEKKYEERNYVCCGRAPRKSIGSLGAARRAAPYREENDMNNDFFNFLKYSGYSITDIEPINIDTNDQSAKFEIKFESNIFNNYSYMQIILMDDESVNSNLICLCENNDKYKIETRDITNPNSLDGSKNYSEINKIESIRKGEKFNINELSKYILIDSINKLSQYFLINIDKNKNSIDKQYWEQYKFIFNLEKMNEKEFLKKYDEISGHEINLFLYFKFPELFDKHLKNYLKYKFEKTFIDYFLLDDYNTLIQYLTPLKTNSLSTFELCLLLLKLINNNPNESEKIKNIIKSRVLNPKNLENHFLTNFNIIINMSLNNNSDNPEESDNSDEDEEEEEEEESNNDTENKQIKDEVLCDRYPVYRCRRSLRIRANEAMNIEESEDILDNLVQTDKKKRKDNYDNAVKNAEKDIGSEFEKPGNVKEYKERHYYIEEYESKEIVNPLWLDFAGHIIREKTHKNFLSKNILYNQNVNINEIIYILSVIDLPINSLKHEYKKNKISNTTSINPSSNAILLNKEIAETNLDLNNKLLISQRINDDDYDEKNIDTNNCTINNQYEYQMIVTNISNKSLNFKLFIQIPQGAIGLGKTYFTNTFQIELKPYETKDYKIYFYFPKEGTFTQYYPVASQNNKIISIGNSMVYKVKKEYKPYQRKEIAGNNKYAKDIRIEGKLRNILADGSINSETKLEKIINYFKNDIFNDDDIYNVLYLVKNNKKFYSDLINILRNRGYYYEKLWAFSFHHKDEKSISEYLSVNTKIIEDLGYDFKSKLYSYNEINDAAKYPHIEYNPVSNARKHTFGNNSSKNELMIANKEFKETYEKFIINLLSLRQLTIKEKLQLSYYLIIQDRMDEALEAFNLIKKEELQESNNNKSFKIQYDYIYAYLDFTFGYPEFKIAKSVCNYYKDFPFKYWREKFEEIEEELLEYENKENRTNELMDIVEEEKDKKSLVKELKEKEPKLSFNLQKEGKIVLFHSNINEITIKLYLIDLEIIFTREPKITEIINKNY